MIASWSDAPSFAVVGEVSIIHKSLAEEFDTWNSTDANADDIAKISIFGGSYRNGNWRAQFKNPQQLFHSAYQENLMIVYLTFKHKKVLLFIFTYFLFIF